MRPRDLGRRVDRLEEAAGVNACATCATWADVILLERPDEKSAPFSPAWGPWAKHKGKCPACGREPALTKVKTAISAVRERRRRRREPVGAGPVRSLPGPRRAVAPEPAASAPVQPEPKELDEQPKEGQFLPPEPRDRGDARGLMGKRF